MPLTMHTQLALDNLVILSCDFLTFLTLESLHAKDLSSTVSLLTLPFYFNSADRYTDNVNFHSIVIFIIMPRPTVGGIMRCCHLYVSPSVCPVF